MFDTYIQLTHPITPRIVQYSEDITLINNCRMHINPYIPDDVISNTQFDPAGQYIQLSRTPGQGRTGHRGYRGNPRWADEVEMVQNTGPLPSPTGLPTYTAGTFNDFPYYTEHV